MAPTRNPAAVLMPWGETARSPTIGMRSRMGQLIAAVGLRTSPQHELGRNCRGFTGSPLTLVSRCRWDPVEFPVLPTDPIR